MFVKYQFLNFMNQLVKFLAISSLTTSILLVVTACGESSHTNPLPATPPLTAKITYPEGTVQTDSATYERVMRGPIPDSIPRPASAPPRPSKSPFLLKKPR